MVPGHLVRMRDLLVLIAGLAAIIATGLLLRELPDISPTTVALAFLLNVLGTATIGRLPAAIVVSVAAMLALNFFFLPPVGAFTIADPQNWIALFAFLVVAVIASLAGKTTHVQQILFYCLRSNTRRHRRDLLTP